MAAGDIIAGPTVSADGRTVAITVEGMTAASTTYSPTGVVFDIVSRGYNNGVLGTTARTSGATFESATQSGADAIVTLRLHLPIYAKDKTGAGNSGTDPTFTAPTAWVTDGTTNAAAASAAAVTNNSTLAYLASNIRICGIIDAGGNLLMPYSRVTGTFTVEAIGGCGAFGKFGAGANDGQPFDKVDLTVTDSDTPTPTSNTTAIQAMSRSTYVPTKFYAKAVTEGLLSATPSHGGGSGVYKASADSSLYIDGALTVEMKAYPRVGDVTVTDTWTVRNDDGGTLASPTVRYVDSRFTIGFSAIGTLTQGERVTQAVTGATGWYWSDDGSTAKMVQGNYIAFDSSNTITGADSGQTITPNAAPSYNGDDSNAGTTGAPWRRLHKALDAMAGSTATQRWSILLRASSDHHTFYTCGHDDFPTPATMAEWGTIGLDSGVDTSWVTSSGVGDSNPAGGDTIRTHLVKIQGVRTQGAYQGHPSFTPNIWLDDCSRDDGGPTGETGTWWTQQFDDSWITRAVHNNQESRGLDQLSGARDVAVDNVNEIMFGVLGFALEIGGRDNEGAGAAPHEDAIKTENTGANGNRAWQNIFGTEIFTTALYRCDNENGIWIGNYLSMTSGVSSPVGCDIGNLGTAHTVKDWTGVHWTLVNTNSFRGNESGLGDTDENIFIGYSVIPSIDPAGKLFYAIYNYANDNTGAAEIPGLYVTATNFNPWVNGVGPNANDNASTRDYHPASAALQIIPSGERVLPYDLFGFERPNDGTAYVGALEPAAASGDGMVRSRGRLRFRSR